VHTKKRTYLSLTDKMKKEKSETKSVCLCVCVSVVCILDSSGKWCDCNILTTTTTTTHTYVDNYGKWCDCNKEIYYLLFYFVSPIIFITIDVSSKRIEKAYFKKDRENFSLETLYLFGGFLFVAGVIVN